MAPLTIQGARRKLELGIERQTAIVKAQEERIELAKRNREDAEYKLDEARRRRVFLSERIRELNSSETAAETLP